MRQKITFRLLTGLAGGILAIGLIGGCSRQSGDQTSSAANNAGNSFDRDVQHEKKWADEAAGKTGQAAQHFAANAEKAADNDQTSMAVKSALMSAKNMNTSRMRVDTNGHKVTLSGSVPSEDERSRASQISRNVLGGGYTVNNQLTVSAF